MRRKYCCTYYCIISPKVSSTLTPIPRCTDQHCRGIACTVDGQSCALRFDRPLSECDPIRAAGEWRDREAERCEKKHGKIRRPGVPGILVKIHQSLPRVLLPRNFFADNLDAMVHRGCVIVDEPAHAHPDILFSYSLILIRSSVVDVSNIASSILLTQQKVF